jgi:hypothetical protein
MRKLLLFSAGLASLSATPALAQAVSGGQAPQYGTEVRANPYGSTNAVDQYLQQKQINNVPNQRAANSNAAKLGATRPAAATELTSGAIVNDNTGIAIARIDQVEGDGVVVAMGNAKVKILADAFEHNKAGLLLDMTKAQFEQIVAQANAAS